ncbi:MAG TPA: acyl-CoA dehydrogenase family protein [Phycisphaerae bacterium]|nr:acyl-CoA dehydrogenase family protein [Phycisphaerae bacterium]
MANFFTDNEDIQFLFDHMDLARLAGIMEEGFRYAEQFEYAPVDAADAVDNYRRILNTLGELAGAQIAPTAEETDLAGNKLNDDGSVTYASGIAEAIKLLGQADLMGFTLPYRFGGLNCPNLVYTMSNEIVSRADASLMNIYGLQGIAETINAFASEEVKAEYLPDMAAGRKTGAMVLTEPDAGSDLQAVKVRGYQDADGNWYVQGVKRFITNGCGDILLVLARTEPEISDGRGLSLLLVERGPRVKVRRLEDKLGIHGSPTCEIFFDDAPAKLIGERQRGLVTYVMSLMNGARVGIAAQSLGIAEAAYRVGRDFAHSRRQFGVAVETFPALRDLITEMQVDIQAARALTYFAGFCVDIEYGALRKLEFGSVEDAAEKKALRTESRKYKRYNGMITPMSKYYASEMCMRVANGAVAVLGGSGYMKDYPVERHLRDSRITTIYEGTTQLQVLAAVRGVSSGSAVNLLTELIQAPSTNSGQADWPSELAEPVEKIKQGKALLEEAIAFVKEQPGTEYMDLVGRRLVDMAIYLIVAALFAGHAAARAEKKAVLHRWLAMKMPELRMNHEIITSGDRSAIEHFETLAGPLPVVD